jgi:hypothetical protein
MSENSLRYAIEIGHPGPEEANNHTLTVGLALGSVIHGNGDIPEFIVFVDEVAVSQRPAGRFFSTFINYYRRKLEDVLSEEGLNARVLYESEMIERGLAIVDEIKEREQDYSDARLSRDGGKLIMGSGENRQRIRLLGYGNHVDLPSCEVMDLACYELKLSEADRAITVIGERYRAQQKRVRLLAQFLDWSLPVEVVYVDAEGQATDTESWLTAV